MQILFLLLFVVLFCFHSTSQSSFVFLNLCRQYSLFTLVTHSFVHTTVNLHYLKNLYNIFYYIFVVVCLCFFFFLCFVLFLLFFFEPLCRLSSLFCVSIPFTISLHTHSLHSTVNLHYLKNLLHLHYIFVVVLSVLYRTDYPNKKRRLTKCKKFFFLF